MREVVSLGTVSVRLLPGIREVPSLGTTSPNRFLAQNRSFAVGPIIACFAPRSARIVVLDTVFVVPVRGTMGVFVIISCGLFSSPAPVPVPIPTLSSCIFWWQHGIVLYNQTFQKKYHLCDLQALTFLSESTSITFYIYQHGRHGNSLMRRSWHYRSHILVGLTSLLGGVGGCMRVYEKWTLTKCDEFQWIESGGI